MRGKKLLIGLIAAGMLPVFGMPAHAGSASFSTSTYAGGGIGDGAPAVNAILSGAADAVAAGSSVYISERTANRIRKVTSTGIISTVAGTGVGSPAGLGSDGSGNVLVADTGNDRIRKIDTGTGTVSTIAGSGSSADDVLSSPKDVVADGAEIYIADTGNNKIKKIDAGGIVTSYADMSSPQAVAIDASATPHVLYVAGGGSIQRIDMSDPIAISTLPSPAGDVSALGLAFDNGNLYASTSGRTVVEIDPANGSVADLAGSGLSGSTGDGGSATSATFMHPAGLAIASDGALLVADDQASRVRRIWGGNIEAYAGNGELCFAGDGGPSAQAVMGSLDAIAIDGSSNVYVADGCEGRVRKINSSGSNTITTIAGNGTLGPALDGIPATSATFGGKIGGIVAASSSVVYVSDTVNNVVRKIQSGTISTVAPITSPLGLALDSLGNLYVASACRVWKIPNGSTTPSPYAGTGTCGLTGEGGAPIAATAAEIDPYGLAVDSSNRVLIAEALNDRVRRVNTDLTISTIAGADAGLLNPTGVTVGLGGVVYIADQGTHRIRMVGGDGIPKIVAGTGTTGYLDASSGGSAKLASPSGVALRAGSSSLYVADRDNGRVRKISLPDQNPPISSINPVAQINQSNQASVQVTGQTESKAVVTLSASDGTSTVQTSAPPSVNSTGNWTGALDVTSLGDGTITFTANVVDEHGNVAPPVTKTALKDVVGSGMVSELTAKAEDGKVTLNWKNTDPEITGAVVRKASGKTAPTMSTGEVVPNPATTSATATGLTNCTWYSFSVFAKDASGNTSSTPATATTRPVPVKPPAAAVRIQISTGVVHYGEPVFISGELVRAGSNDNIPEERVYIQVRRKGTKEWVSLTPAGVDTTAGRFTYMHKPVWSADYWIRHVPSGCAADATSPIASVAVRPVIKASLNPTTVVVGGTAVISGTIAPAQYGQPIYLQRLANNSWANVTSMKLSGTGTTFSFSVRPTWNGRAWYRIFKPADNDHAGNAMPGSLMLSSVRAAIIGILYDPPGDEKANLNSEYAVIKNTGSLAFDLYGWTLYGVGKNKGHKLPKYVLAPGATVLVHSGSGTTSYRHIYLGRTTPFWKNQTDTGQLYDPRGNLASSFRYQ